MDQFRPRGDRIPTRDIQQGLQDLKRLLDDYSGGGVLWLVVLVLVALYMSTGVYKVGPGEKGVVLLFGKLHAVSEPGLRYRLPKPFMSHQLVDVEKVRGVELGMHKGKDDSKIKTAQSGSVMLTGDQYIVDVQFFVQYKVHDPVKFLFGCDRHELALRTSCEVALRGVVAERSIDYTMTEGRERIQEDVRNYLQKLLDAYNTGLYATQARLQAVDPPGEVKDAFHDVVRAREDKARLINEAEGYEADVVPKARGAAQQEISQAEAYQTQREIKARGDASRFERILPSTPDFQRSLENDSISKALKNICLTRRNSLLTAEIRAYCRCSPWSAGIK